MCGGGGYPVGVSISSLIPYLGPSCVLVLVKVDGGRTLVIQCILLVLIIGRNLTPGRPRNDRNVKNAE